MKLTFIIMCIITNRKQNTTNKKFHFWNSWKLFQYQNSWKIIHTLILAHGSGHKKTTDKYMYNLQSVWARGRFSIRFSPASFSSLSACSFRLLAASTELSSMSRTSVTGSRSVIGRISVWLSSSLSRSVTTLRQYDVKAVTLRMIGDLVWSSQSKFFPFAKKFQLQGQSLFPTPILLK